MNNDFQSNCGGKRRGCCIIQLPHDDQPAYLTLNSTDQCDFLFVLGLSAGGSPTWAVVSLPDSEAPDTLGEAIR
jgi:hypothetical protein